MKLMCLLEHTLEIPLKVSPDLKFPRQVVILSARRPNLPSVKLKCSSAVICNKQTKVMWKICILAKVWWGESGAEDDGAHPSDEGFSRSSFISCSFSFVFSYGSKVWPPWEIKMCFASTDFVLMGVPSSINIVPTNNSQSKFTAFMHSARKSPLEPELHQHRSQAALTAWLGSVTPFHALKEKDSITFKSSLIKTRSQLKWMQSFSSTLTEIRGLERYQKGCL